MWYKLLILILLVFAVFFLVNNFAPDSARDAGKALTAPFRYAALAAKEPDQTIKIPIRGIEARQIADTFHAARDGGERLHQGLDIFAPRGTPIYSATDGYVWRIGENRLGGKTVSVLGAGARVYYYAHLDAYAADLAVGEPVTNETVLGYVGTTGNAQGTPPHVHFSVYTAEGAINPGRLFEN